MSGIPSERVSLEVVRRCAVALLAVALLLSSFGPLLDHHFAERQFDHVHLYFGPAAPDHSHPYEAPHPHSHAAAHAAAHAIVPGAGRVVGEAAPGAGLAEAAIPQDIVFLAGQDADGYGSAPLIVSSMPLSVNFPGPGDSALRHTLVFHDRIPPEAFIPPPKKPPRI